MNDRPGDTRRAGVHTGTFGVSSSSRNDRAFRTQLRCQGTELREPRGLRWLEIVFDRTHRRGDGQMPARLRRSMRVGLRACVCRSAMVREVNVS